MPGTCQDDSDSECPRAHDIASCAVKKVFAILGVDIDKPESVEEFREDLRFGRRMRRASERGMMVAVGFFVVAACGALLLGLGMKFKGG